AIGDWWVSLCPAVPVSVLPSCLSRKSALSGCTLPFACTTSNEPDHRPERLGDGVVCADAAVAAREPLSSSKCKSLFIAALLGCCLNLSACCRYAHSSRDVPAMIELSRIPSNQCPLHFPAAFSPPSLSHSFQPALLAR